MIKKILKNFILLLFSFLVIFLIILSTFGFETNKFNKLVSNKISKSKNIYLELDTLNFKLDIKELSLFVETTKPKISYKNSLIPTELIKVYIDFLPLLKTDVKVKKINIFFQKLDYPKIKELTQFIKPSNLKSFLVNKITKAKLISEIEFFLDNEGTFKNYIFKGKVKNLEAELLDELKLSKTSFNFFADKEDVLIKNITSNIDDIKIDNGDIKLSLENGIKLNSNFMSEVNLNNNKIEKYNNIFKNYNFFGKIGLLDGNFSNNIFIDFDNTYKLINYNYSFSGKIKKSNLELNDIIKNDFINEEIKEIYFTDLIIDANFSPKFFDINTKGKYSLDNLEYSNFNIDSNIKKSLLQLNGDFDYINTINLNFINYIKPKNTNANLSLEIIKEKDLVGIKRLIFKSKNDVIEINNLNFKNNNFESLKKIEVKTSNNNFSIHWDKQILIKGSNFDATNLPKYLNNQKRDNYYNQINSNIEIDFKNIKAPLSEKLKNFRLIGEIKRGKFIKITSKGDFGDNNFLDISMQKDEKTEKKFLEIYSDLSRPLLTEYSFFKGLSGGKLLFTSLIDDSKSISKLKIENFKVINAPGVIKLLSLADLGGLADLAEGDGISFDVLEIDMEKDENYLKLNEILALGPSMSVLMEGYQVKDGVTSLKGTLVPAKTLNNMISKIPVIGNIVIPKEVGEGLFGVSFKMKGLKGNIKTTINPIRTLTPRFIQKIIDKNKQTK